jgi:Cys-rich protein (TIGR01571 family)
VQAVQPTIINQQPTGPQLEYPFHGATAIERWGKGICDCTEDCGGCILACCCPCIVYGQNMENALGMSSSCAMNGLVYLAAMCLPALIGCPGLCCFVTCNGRKQIDTVLAGQSNGQTTREDDMHACCCHYWCEPCALAQEKRAIDAWRKAGGQPGMR